MNSPSNIIFSPQQAAGLQKFEEWFAQARKEYTGEQEAEDLPASVPQVFKIFGFAGSGKTTIAALKAKEIGRGVMAATFTGKAALVMKRKGFNCSTIHSLIYKVKEVPKLDAAGKETGEFERDFVLNAESDLRLAKLLIVDEVSMVGEDLGRDLLSFNVPILVLGDPGQLPPISGAGFFTNGQPNVMLTETHRQALGNPIIRLSMDIRLGKGAKLGVQSDDQGVERVRVLRKAALDRRAALVSADQVLCGLNRTRRTMNAEIRGYIGFDQPQTPMPGEKLICLRNNRRKGLFNGGMWQVDSIEPSDVEFAEMQLLSLDHKGHKCGVKVPLEFFRGEEDKIPQPKRRRWDEFDWGYAITTHKSQGSQWDNVLVMNENYCFREHAIQWLYTAVTRAAERLTLVI